MNLLSAIYIKSNWLSECIIAMKFQVISIILDIYCKININLQDFDLYSSFYLYYMTEIRVSFAYKKIHSTQKAKKLPGAICSREF